MGADPVVDTLEEIFFGHQNALLHWRSMQAALVEFAGGQILVHHQFGEVNDI